MPEESDFQLEPLFARGNRVYTWDKAIQMACVSYGPDIGLTEHEARQWAALLAQGPRMYRLIVALATGQECGELSPITAEARKILAAAKPKPKGRPFKRPEDRDDLPYRQGGGEGGFDDATAEFDDITAEI